MATMTPLLAVASVLSGLNIALLLGLSWVWGRNYRTFQTPLTLGLLGFALVLLVENVVAIYFFVSSGMLYAGSGTAQMTVLAMRVLQFVALGLLTVVTMR